MAVPDRPKETWSIDGAIKALLLSSMAYLIAFCYEGGYLSFFGVPLVFAEVSLRGLLLCLIGGYGILGGIIWQVDLAWNMFTPERMDARVGEHVRKHLYVFSMVGTFTILVGANALTISALLVVAVITIFDFVHPIIVHRRLGSFVEKLAASDRVDAKLNRGPLGVLEKLIERLPTDFVLIAVFGVQIAILAWGVGYFRARQQESFALVEGEEPCIAIGLRQEGFLCIGVAPFSRNLTGEFHFIEPKGKAFREVKLGKIVPMFDFTGGPI